MARWKDIKNKLHSDGMAIPPTLPATTTAEVTEKRKSTSWKNIKETKTVDTINTDNEYNFDKNKSYLVINGRAKEIGRKSKYLLDMLIIDKED